MEEEKKKREKEKKEKEEKEKEEKEKKENEFKNQIYVKKSKNSIKICQLKKKSKKFGKLSEAGDAVALRVFAYSFFFSGVSRFERFALIFFLRSFDW